MITVRYHYNINFNITKFHLYSMFKQLTDFSTANIIT